MACCGISPRVFKFACTAFRRTFRGSTDSISSPQPRPATRIGPGLNQLAAESATLPIGAVVLLTDGADNSGGIDRDTVAALRAHRLPVSVMGFGKDKPRPRRGTRES